jgi:hypothetical protein
MNLGNCTHKEELTSILTRGAWPLAASAELLAHVAACRDCSARLRLTLGLRALRSESIAAAPQLPPGLIWWRAQIRRRHEAIERVGRPLIAGQILALAAGLCILCIAWLPQRNSFQPGPFPSGSFSIWWANLWTAAAPPSDPPGAGPSSPPPLPPSSSPLSAFSISSSNAPATAARPYRHVCRM